MLLLLLLLLLHPDFLASSEICRLLPAGGTSLFFSLFFWISSGTFLETNWSVKGGWRRFPRR